MTTEAARLDEFATLREAEWLDISTVIQMDDEWKNTLLLVSRFNFLLTALIALAVLFASAYIFAVLDYLWFFIFSALILAGGGLLAKRLFREMGQRPPVEDLQLAVAYSIGCVTLAVYLLGQVRGDFYLLYFLPLVSAAGYLGIAGGFTAGLVSGIIYSAVVFLTLPVTSAIITAVGLRVLVFVLIASLLGVIAERHVNLLEALRASHRRAIHLAITDSKTELYTHRYFDLRLRQELARSRRANISLAFVVCKIDNLPSFNDAYGFTAGDQLLAEIGRIIAAQIRLTDVGTRWASDEFGFLLFNTDAAGAQIVIGRILAAMNAIRLTGRSGEETRKVLLSFGIAVFPAQATSETELTDRAYEAMRRAHTRAVGSTVIWSPTD